MIEQAARRYWESIDPIPQIVNGPTVRTRFWHWLLRRLTK